MNDVAIRQDLLDAIKKVNEKLDPELEERLLNPETDIPLAEFGMDSLEAIQCCMEIETLTGVSLDPAELAAAHSFSGLSCLIANRRLPNTVDDTPAPLVRVSRDDPLPLSLPQKAIWTYCRNPNPGYAIHFVDRFVGRLDVEVFCDCLTDIVERNEIFRTTFMVVNGEPQHIINAPGPIAVTRLQLPPDADPKIECTSITKQETLRVSDPARGPLARFTVIKISESEHWLVFVAHHLIWDAWSTRLLRDELAQLYNAKLKHLPTPESQSLEYVDFASWQRLSLRPDGKRYQEVIRWWRMLFEGKPQQLNPPFTRSTPITGLDPSEGQFGKLIDSETQRRLHELQRNESTTTYMVWLAALVALLSAETEQPDIIVGTYITHRRRAVLQNMYGYFSNLVSLRFQCDQALSFREWLREVKAFVLEAQEYCEIPLEDLRAVLQEDGVDFPPIQLIFDAPLEAAREDTEYLDLKVSRPFLGIAPVMPTGFTIILETKNKTQTCHAIFDAGYYETTAVRAFIQRLCTFVNDVSRLPDLSLEELLTAKDGHKVGAAHRASTCQTT